MIPVEVESWKISRLAEGGSNPVEVRMIPVEVNSAPGGSKPPAVEVKNDSGGSRKLENQQVSGRWR